jgi:hypothetical protein
MRLVFPTIIIMILLVVFPAVSANQTQNAKIISAHRSGNTITEKIMLPDGSVITENPTISSSGSVSVIYWLGNTLTFPTYIGNTPYSWLTGISNPPEVLLYINPAFALNSKTGSQATIVLLGGAGLIVGPLGGAVGAIVGGLIALDYSSLYDGGHNPDNSLNIWLPVDWYNIDVSLAVSHDLYVPTPHNWWIITPVGSYITGSR